MSSAVVQVANFGADHFSGPQRFDDALDQALSQPNRHWSSDLEELAHFGHALELSDCLHC